MKFLCNATLRPHQHFPETLKMLVDGVNDPRRKTYSPLPMLILLRRHPSSRVWNTEENGARKGHAEREARPSLSALMPWPVFFFSINFCSSSSSWCCIIVAKSPSLMIIYSFFSRFCTSSSSSCCSANVSRASLKIAALSSGGLAMATSTYRYWGELIYHLFRTDLLKSIFGLFSTLSFEKLSSSCFNIAAIIASLSVAGEHLLRYKDVPLTS